MAEQLRGWLMPVNDPAIQARVGQETLVDHGVDDHGRWLVTHGERFRQTSGWVQGVRYLRLNVDGELVAVANVTLRRQGRHTEARLSNLYVAPEIRRQGWARRLILQVLADHPRLVGDSSLSEAGAATIGQAAGDAPNTSRRRRTP